MNLLISCIVTLEGLCMIAMVVATPILIYLKIKERKKEKAEEEKSNYSDY